MAQQAMEQALLRHERVRKSTDLPLFYGRKDKDTIKPQDFLLRFEAASQIAGWVPVPAAGQPPNEAQKCQQFFLLMRDSALDWWQSLEDVPNLDMTSWQQVKPQFVKHYLPKYTARTACTTFSDLTQTSGELVADFYLRVNRAYRLLKECRPPILFQADEAIPDIPAGADDAARDALIQAYGERCQRTGVERMGLYVVQSMFTAGLAEEIRIKTMDARCATLEEAKDQAMGFETVIRDKRGSKALVSSVENSTEYDEEVEQDEDDDELLDQINAIRRQRGKKPVRFARGGKPKVTVICRYCKKSGHFQRECFKRKKENGAMLDAQGKPMKFNSIEEEQTQSEKEEETEEEDGAIQSISHSLARSYYGICSIRESTSDTDENDSPQGQNSPDSQESQEEDDESEIYIAPFHDHSFSEDSDEELEERVPTPIPMLWKDPRKQSMWEHFMGLDRLDQEWDIEWSTIIPMIVEEMPGFWANYGFRSPFQSEMGQTLRPFHPSELMIPVIEAYQKHLQKDPMPLIAEIQGRSYLSPPMKSKLARSVITKLKDPQIRQRVIQEPLTRKILHLRDYLILNRDFKDEIVMRPRSQIDPLKLLIVQSTLLYLPVDQQKEAATIIGCEDLELVPEKLGFHILSSGIINPDKIDTDSKLPDLSDKACDHLNCH